MDPHRLAELRSIALHRAIGEELRRRPDLIEAARHRLASSREPGKGPALYREAWLALLSEPLERVVAFLSEDSERARELRQATPFAGVIPPSERWRIWKYVREAEKTP